MVTWVRRVHDDIIFVEEERISAKNTTESHVHSTHHVHVHCVVGIPKNAMGSSPLILHVLCTYKIAYRKSLIRTSDIQACQLHLAKPLAVNCSHVNPGCSLLTYYVTYI